jgi:bifunctional N-acetylglucosamine-1-phosphate-uridyltransferase/glucosamine-1-phosphate-acetyltransferase GlmU-like protein
LTGIPEVDRLTGTWARPIGAVVPLPEREAKPRIHPTAIVERGAELGPGVEIGPYSYVGPHVVLGPGCTVGLHVILEGWTSIGPRCQIHHGAVIGNIPQDLKFRGVPSKVVVGADTTIREYATIHAATEEGEATCPRRARRRPSAGSAFVSIGRSTSRPDGCGSRPSSPSARRP